MYRFLLLTCLFLFLMIPLAFAQDTGSITIPWGDWAVNAINFLLPTVLTLLGGVATYVIGAYVPPWLRAIAGTSLQARVNQILEKAVLSAVAQTKGAIMGQRLSIPIGIEVLRKAAQYAVDQAPELIKAASQDEVDQLLKMILARMEQWGVAPKNLDVNKVGKSVLPKGKENFDFGKEISKQMGK